MTGFFNSGVEMFSTESKNDPDMFDRLYIIGIRKKYILEIEDSDFLEGLYDVEAGYEVLPTIVSRAIFDLIISGLGKRGFRKIKTSY